LHADGAAVQLDQTFREREAEARPFVAAALARVELHELLKQLSLIRRGDPDASVAHGDPHGAGVLEPRAEPDAAAIGRELDGVGDRKSTRLNSSHVAISYAVFCLKKKKTKTKRQRKH